MRDKRKEMTNVGKKISFEIWDYGYACKTKGFSLGVYVSPPLCYHPNNMSLPKFRVRSWQGDVLNVGKEWNEFIFFVSFSSSVF